MTELVLGIRLTADGKDLVGAVKVSTEEIDKLGGATKRVSSESERLNEQQKGLGATLNANASSIGAYTALWNFAAEAIKSAAGAIKDYIKDAALLNARYEELGIVMKVVGSNVGYTSTQMENAALGMQKLGITMIESRNATIQLAQAQIPLAYAEKLADAARNTAVIGMTNTSDAMQRMIYGIKSGQTEVLRTLGLNVNFEASYKKLAAQLGVTTEQLTEQEKVLVRANATTEEASRASGAYEAAMTSASKQLRSMARYTEDLKVIRGEVFNEALVIAVDAYTDSLKDANAETRRLSDNKKLQEWGRDLVTTFAWIGDIIIGAVDGIASSVELMATATMRSLNGIRNAALMAFPGAKIVAGLLGNVTGVDIDAYINSFGAKVGENVDARLNRKQFRASAKEFYANKDADAAARQAKAENDAYEEADLQRGADAIRTVRQPRPEGKSSAEQVSEYSKLAVVLQQKLDIDKQSTEVEKLQFALDTMLLSKRKEISGEEEKDLFRMAELLDAKNQELAVNKAGLEYAKAVTDQQDKLNDAVASFNATQSQNLQNLQFETQLLGIEAPLAAAGLLTKEGEIRLQSQVSLQRDTANGLRQIELDLQKALLALGPETNENYEAAAANLRALADAQKAALPDALATREAARLTSNLAKNQVSEFNSMWSTVEGTGKQVWSLLTAGGENMATSVGKAIKAAVWDLLYQMTIRKWTINIGASVAGTFGMSGATNAATSAGGIGNGLSLLSSANNSGLFGMGLTGMADYAAGFATTATASQAAAAAMIESGTAGFAGAGMEAGAASMGFSAAIPYVGAAILAMYALGVFDSDERQKVLIGTGITGKMSRAGFTGSIASNWGTSPDDRWGGTSLDPVTAQVGATISNTVKKLFADMEAAAIGAGYAVSGLDQVVVDFTTSSKNGDQTQADLTAALNSTSDAIALKIMPGLAMFQLQGETLGQTFSRVIAAINAEDAALKAMNRSVSDFTLEVQSADPAFEQYMAQVRNFDAGIADLFSTIDKLDLQSAIAAEQNLMQLIKDRYALENDHLRSQKTAIEAAINGVGDLRQSILLGRATPANQTSMLGADFRAKMAATSGLSGTDLATAANLAVTAASGYVSSINSTYGSGAKAQQLLEGVLGSIGSLSGPLAAADSTVVLAIKDNQAATVAELKKVVAELTKQTEQLSGVRVSTATTAANTSGTTKTDASAAADAATELARAKAAAAAYNPYPDTNGPYGLA